MCSSHIQYYTSFDCSVCVSSPSYTPVSDYWVGRISDLDSDYPFYHASVLLGGSYLQSRQDRGVYISLMYGNIVWRLLHTFYLAFLSASALT